MPIAGYCDENRTQMRLRVRERSGTRELSDQHINKPGNLMTMSSYAISLRTLSARIDRRNCWGINDEWHIYSLIHCTLILTASHFYVNKLCY